MADKRWVDRVGRTHVAEDTFRVRPYCGYMGVLTEEPEAVESEYPCPECAAAVGRRLTRDPNAPREQPGRRLL